jgi:P63C domain
LPAASRRQPRHIGRWQRGLGKWVKTFPLAYFRGLCRLKNVPFSENMRLPQYFGHITNDLVYSRLAPGVLAEVQKRNPRINGHRKNKNFQHLTENIGHPSLLRLLGSLVTLMKINTDYDVFYDMVEKVHPPFRAMPLFDQFGNDED